jgi:hypothetical protein
MIERLSGAHRLVLGADATWPQDVGALAILDREVRVGDVRRGLSDRLHLVPRFRQRAFEICVTADGGSVPDVEVVAAGIRDELEALRVHATRGLAQEASGPSMGATARERAQVA